MRSNADLQREIDTFLASAKKLSDEEIIQGADVLEHQIYRNIDEILATFEVKGTKVVADIYDEVTALNNKLSALHDLHIKHPVLFFHNFNPTIIPADRAAEPARYLREQYHHFMDHCLVFGKGSKEKENLGVFVRKLMSQPIGQRLIVKLNEMNEKNGCTISLTEQLQGVLGVQPVAGSERSVNTAMTNTGGNTVSPLKLFDYPRTSWNKIQMFYPPGFWNDTQFIFKALDFGKNKCLAFKPPFISIGHELTHVLHFFRGKDRGKMPFVTANADQHADTLFIKNTEELWTIDLGNISENKLRQEHGIDLRYSHIRAFQFAEGEYSLSEIKDTMTGIHAHSKAEQKETSAHAVVMLRLDDDNPQQCCVIQ
jgi:hypothetical protein